jgi:hypothetical protein
LPQLWTSKALRVAMSQDDWSHFDALVRTVAPQAPTQARAHGMAIAALLHGDRPALPRPAPAPESLDWMDWERQKTLRLLVRKG